MPSPLKVVTKRDKLRRQTTPTLPMEEVNRSPDPNPARNAAHPATVLWSYGSLPDYLLSVVPFFFFYVSCRMVLHYPYYSACGDSVHISENIALFM